MDIIHDNSWNSLLQISEKLDGNLPLYVKEYTPLTKESASTLDDELFADNRNRLFPIDSPANAWTSAMYFAYNHDALPYKVAEFAHVKNRLVKAAEIYNVTDDVNKAIDQINKEPPAKDPLDSYGLVVKEGSKTRAEFPMFDATGVEKASKHFAEYRQKYPADWRQEIASNIMRKASEFDVPFEKLANAVLSEAGYGIPDKHALMEEILYRAGLAKNAENATLLANLNFMLADLPIEDFKDELGKIASVMSDFDVAEGLDTQYNKKVMPPADIVFGLGIKQAEAVLNDALKLNKFIFSATKLASAISPSLLDNLMGDGFTAQLTKDNKLIPEKLASALVALPMEDKIALEEYLQNTYE